MASLEVDRFWEHKSLKDMTKAEWESLCDGCARCCMIKLEDEKSGSVDYTAVVCELLDLESCQCTRYSERGSLVPDCVHLTPDKALQFKWLPTTCAYRRLAEGKPLEDWHPLVSNSNKTVHQAQISIRDKVVSEASVHEEQYQDMVVRWVDH